MIIKKPINVKECIKTISMTFYRLFIQKDVTNLINHVFCSQILNYETCVDADQGVRIGTGPSRQHRKDKRISVQEHTMTDNASDLPVSGNELNSKICLLYTSDAADE